MRGRSRARWRRVFRIVDSRVRFRRIARRFPRIRSDLIRFRKCVFARWLGWLLPTNSAMPAGAP